MEKMPTIRFIPANDPRSTRPSLKWDAIARTLKTANSVIRVGRYSERDNPPPSPSSNAVTPVGFKSKVVSRKHCEFWCAKGQWYVKDVASSSGTFLNHVRLSPPNKESRAYTVNDGDVVQLGIDFKGGEEVIFRCIKIRIECNRGWQKALNAYNTSAHKRLLKSVSASKASRESDAASINASECAICLNQIGPLQSLFVAPCSHAWHYKCIRSLLHGVNYPNFVCPNCRFVIDLEADIEPLEDLQADFKDDALNEEEEEELENEVQDAEAGEEEGNDSSEAADRTSNESTHDTDNVTPDTNIDPIPHIAPAARPSLAEAAARAYREGPLHNGIPMMTDDVHNALCNWSRLPTRPIKLDPRPAFPTLAQEQAADAEGIPRSITPTSDIPFALAAGIGEGIELEIGPRESAADIARGDGRMIDYSNVGA
jgi:pSer/pThr/pTyr-binding forkhead associated (FHA) protein